MRSKCSIPALFAAGADDNSPVIHQHATLIKALMRRRAYWPAARQDGSTGHTNHGRHHILTRRKMWWRKQRRDFLQCWVFQAGFKPCQNIFLKGKASITIVFSGFTASSRGWGPGCHGQTWMITDGGVLRVDLLMVQEPARSSVFPVSLHHRVGRTNGA